MEITMEQFIRHVLQTNPDFNTLTKGMLRNSYLKEQGLKCMDKNEKQLFSRVVDRIMLAPATEKLAPENHDESSASESKAVATSKDSSSQNGDRKCPNEDYESDDQSLSSQGGTDGCSSESVEVKGKECHQTDKDICLANGSEKDLSEEEDSVFAPKTGHKRKSKEAFASSDEDSSADGEHSDARESDVEAELMGKSDKRQAKKLKLLSDSDTSDDEPVLPASKPGKSNKETVETESSSDEDSSITKSSTMQSIHSLSGLSKKGKKTTSKQDSEEVKMTSKRKGLQNGHKSSGRKKVKESTEEDSSEEERSASSENPKFKKTDVSSDDESSSGKEHSDVKESDMEDELPVTEKSLQQDSEIKHKESSKTPADEELDEESSSEELSMKQTEPGRDSSSDSSSEKKKEKKLWKKKASKKLVKSGTSSKENHSENVNPRGKASSGGERGSKSASESKIDRLKKYLKIAGIHVRCYMTLWESCKTNKAKIEKLLQLLHNKGLKGTPTIEKCKKLRKQIERKKEIQELDMSNIITSEGRPKRNVRSMYLSKKEEGEITAQVASNILRESEPVFANQFAKLKDILDSEESD